VTKEKHVPNLEKYVPSKYVPVNLSNDVLWGVSAIADYVRRGKQQTYYLIKIGALPVRKLGPRTICARKSELDRALAQVEAENA
jgi:hypothetical protein